MTTLPQAKEATISFRCDPDWKRNIDRWLVDHGYSMQELGRAALSKFTGIKHPEKSKCPTQES